MSDNTWTKVIPANAWDFKTEKEIEGVFVSKEEHVGENDSTVFTLEKPDHTLITVWGSTVLDARMKNIKPGEEVKIVYLGQADSEKRKGKFYHNFDVFHREVSMEKV